MNKSDNKNSTLVLSNLGHTWILDLDGTIVKHNGYKIYGQDSFLDGVLEFLKGIPDKDMIIFLTSRTDKYKEITVNFLKDNNVRYDYIIFNAPYGERVLINDDKPSGLKMSIGVCGKRDCFPVEKIIEDEKL